MWKEGSDLELLPGFDQHILVKDLNDLVGNQGEHISGFLKLLARYQAGEIPMIPDAVKTVKPWRDGASLHWYHDVFEIICRGLVRFPCCHVVLPEILAKDSDLKEPKWSWSTISCFTTQCLFLGRWHVAMARNFGPFQPHQDEREEQEAHARPTPYRGCYIYFIINL